VFGVNVLFTILREINKCKGLLANNNNIHIRPVSPNQVNGISVKVTHVYIANSRACILNGLKYNIALVVSGTGRKLAGNSRIVGPTRQRFVVKSE
jgi:hypothetical protein